MTTQPTDRPSRRIWFDSRLAIGIALVVLSVAGVVFIVSSNDSTEPVLAAKEALTPGQIISRDDLTVVDAQVESAGADYLASTDMPSEGFVVSRAVGAGEIVPLSAVGAASSASLAPVVVVAQSGLAGSIAEGSSVDVWAAAETAEGTFATPSVIVPSATVVAVTTTQAIVVDEAERSVELLVPRDKVARLLEAIANDDRLSLVPTAIPVARSK